MNTLQNSLSFLALIGIYLVFYHFIANLILESGRQRLFIIRDTIFDYHIEHSDKLSSSEHESVRNFFNQTIVALEYITVPRILLTHIFQHGKKNQYSNIAALYTGIHDESSKQFIKSQLKKVLPIVIKTMLLRAPITMSIAIFVATVLLVADFINPIPRARKTSVETKFKDSVIDNIFIAV